MRPRGCAGCDRILRRRIRAHPRKRKRNPPNPPNPPRAFSFEDLRQWIASGLGGFGAGFATYEVSLMFTTPDERLIYGCVCADGPEAEPLIDEIDGILVYTCPECRRALKELHEPLPRG